MEARILEFAALLRKHGVRISPAESLDSLLALESTGRTTGPHLLYEIRIDGISKNPRSFIQLANLLKLI